MDSSFTSTNISLYKGPDYPRKGNTSLQSILSRDFKTWTTFQDCEIKITSHTRPLNRGREEREREKERRKGHKSLNWT